MPPNVWDPERLQNLSCIMPRYAPYIRPGDTLTLGVEGDPCNVYGPDEHVRVTEVWSDAQGDLRFRATREGHEDDITLDATSMRPADTWDVVHADTARAVAARVAQERAAPEEDYDTSSTVVYRASVDARLEKMDSALRELQSAFRETTEQLRCFAEDLKHGKARYASTYAATYDRVHAERDVVDAAEKSEASSVYAGEKTEFPVENSAANDDKTIFHVAPNDDKTPPHFAATTRNEKKSRASSVQLTLGDAEKDAYAPFTEKSVVD